MLTANEEVFERGFRRCFSNDASQTLVDAGDQGTKVTAILASNGASGGTGVGRFGECNCNDGDGR